MLQRKKDGTLKPLLASSRRHVHQLFQIKAGTIGCVQVRVIPAKGVNADDGCLISLEVVVVFVFFAFLQPLLGKAERCQKSIHPNTLFGIAKDFSRWAEMVAKQADPVACLSGHQHRQPCQSQS